MSRENEAAFLNLTTPQPEVDCGAAVEAPRGVSTRCVPADVWLLAIGKNHDAGAFAEMFCHFAPRLKMYFVRRRLSAQIAEELTQDIMLAVWNKAAQFDPLRCEAGAWIFTIARNSMIDAIRRDKLQIGADFKDQFNSALDPEQIFVATEREVVVRRALKTLPKNHEEILSLSFFDELTHKEISLRLHQPLGTIKSRIKRAAARLRQVLESSP